MGLSLSDHRARTITGELVEDFDLIITPDQRQKEGLQLEFPLVRERVCSLGELVDGWRDLGIPADSTLDELRELARQIEALVRRALEPILERVGDLSPRPCAS